MAWVLSRLTLSRHSEQSIQSWSGFQQLLAETSPKAAIVYLLPITAPPTEIVSHSWVNCLDCNYQSLDLLSNGWIFVDVALQPLCYEGASLPSQEQIQNYLQEENEVLRGILQDNEEIDEILTDDDDYIVSDNERESDK